MATTREVPDWLKAVHSAYRKVPPIVRDLGLAVFVILLLMAGLWIYTAQPLSQAPLVVVESGSMMHEEAPWGRLGTIDPGDLILVKYVDSADPSEIVTAYGARAPTIGNHFGEGERDGYGDDGDVVIYRQDECRRQDPTPIIHRAITWVEVEQAAGTRVYSYHDANGVWQNQRANVHLPGIGLSSNTDFMESGWITKGDNPVTNRPADQVGICPGQLIQPDWIIGKARGEIAWVGLLKFMVQGNNVNNPPADWCHRFNAVAPCDLFSALYTTLFVLVAIPLIWDVVHRIRRNRQERAETDREDDERFAAQLGTGRGPSDSDVKRPPPPQ